MKANLDIEKIGHILDKVEKWESLDKNEKVYEDIVKGLKKIKNEEVTADLKYEEKLKSDLLKEYWRIYKKKWLFYIFADYMRLPIMRYTVSFWLVAIVLIWVYTKLEFNSWGFSNTAVVSENVSKVEECQNCLGWNIQTTEPTKNISRKMDTFQDRWIWMKKESAAAPEINVMSLQQSDNVIQDTSRDKMNFSSDKVSTDLKWSSESFEISTKWIIISAVAIIIVSVLLFIVIRFIIKFIYKKFK